MKTRVLVSLLGLAGCLTLGNAPEVLAQDDAPAAETKPAEKQAEREVDLDLISDPANEKMKLTAPDTYEALFHTTAGDFTVKVTRAWAPVGADRFYSLVKNGYYDGNRFFRVVPGFVVQWGIHGNKKVNAAWYDPKNREHTQIKDDKVVQSNTRGKIVFATSGPDSRTTQLFINFDDNSNLDKMGFAPFGEITAEDMKIVDKIYSGYGEPPRDLQPILAQNGNAVLDEYFPKMDGIITATIVEKDKQKQGE